MEAVDHDRVRTAGETNSLADVCDGADGGKFILMTGHEQHALLVGGVDGQRDGHAGEDDRIVERNK
jgi:hypothetical protein